MDPTTILHELVTISKEEKKDFTKTSQYIYQLFLLEIVCISSFEQKI